MTKTREQLISFEATTVNFDDLADCLTIIAKDIESAFQRMGAEPGTDYTARDLMQHAIPFALHKWQTRDLEVYHAGMIYRAGVSASAEAP